MSKEKKIVILLVVLIVAAISIWGIVFLSYSRANISSSETSLQEEEIVEEVKEEVDGRVVEAVKTLKSMLKNPDSLQIQEIIVKDGESPFEVYIDYSAMNGFGGYNRERYYFDYIGDHLSDFDELEDYVYINVKQEIIDGNDLFSVIDLDLIEY